MAAPTVDTALPAATRRLRWALRGALTPHWPEGIVLGLVLLYVTGFLAFAPQIPTIVDESSYFRQAELLAQGSIDTDMKLHPLSGEAFPARLSHYPVGTSLLMAAGMWFGGKPGGFAVPLLCLVAGVLLTAHWLREEGRSPLFALVILGFPATLVLGRVAMSDVPSLALVSTGLWLFWRGLDGNRRGYWLGAGFVAGASILFRESNCIPFAFFFAGALLRRDRAWWALLVGGLLGISLRLLSGYVVYGDPLFFKASSAVFGRQGLLHTLPLHLLALLVLVPGGLAGALAYRGRRWPELVAAVLGFCGFYLVYGYNAAEAGTGTRLVLALRFLIPLLPLLAFGMAESFPRGWERLTAGRTPRQRSRLLALRSAVVVTWVAGVACATLLVHWVHDRYAAPMVAIRGAIEQHIDSESVVVSNFDAMSRYLPIQELKHLPLDHRRITRAEVARLASRHGEFFIVVLDRSDSEWWKQRSRDNTTFVDAIRPPPLLTLDREMGTTSRLRIWRVDEINWPAYVGQPTRTPPRLSRDEPAAGRRLRATKAYGGDRSV